MNTIETGKLIAKKRKELNMTQEQLAEKLGVSNKTVSKWETGKCMPDYGIVKELCAALGITAAELIDGAEAEDKGGSSEQIVELLRRTQELERQKTTLFGLILIVMGLALLCLSHMFGGSDFKDFIAGVLLGLSIVEMLAGVYVTARSFPKK